MAQVNPTSLKNWADGDIIKAADYKQEREILYTAINDNYARLVKYYRVLTAAGATKTTMTLTNALNFLQFKESDRIGITLDAATGVLTLTLVAGGVKTADIADSAVTNAKLATNAVATTNLQNLSVTLAKIADGAVTLTKADTASFDTRYYTEVEIDAKFTDVEDALDMKSDTDHTHDDRYYTESDIDDLLDEKAPVEHDHDDIYYRQEDTYTKEEVDTAVAALTGGIAGATDDATADTLVLRDEDAAAHIGTPTSPTHIAQKQNVDAVQTNLTAHINTVSGAHGATSAATASTIVQRDSNSRFKAAAPSASDDVARKAETDAASSAAATAQSTANAALPASEFFKLANANGGAISISSTDLNNLTTAGFYYGSSLGNAPYATSWLVYANAHPSLTLKSQILIDTATGAMYSRTYNVSSVWTAWQGHITSGGGQTINVDLSVLGRHYVKAAGNRAVDIEYNTTDDIGVIGSSQLGTAWKPLEFRASALRFKLNGGSTSYDLINTGGGQTIAGNLTVSRLISNVAQGTAPLGVTSTTLVTNLNADLLGGYHLDNNANANTVPMRDTNKNITAGGFISTHATGAAPFGVSSTTVVTNLHADILDGYHAGMSVAGETIAVRDGNGDLWGRRLVANVANGTAPFVVTSTTQVDNLNANFISGKRVTVASSAPSSPSTGDIWIDTST